MGIGVTELKREVMLREWLARIAECRNSGKAVKAWCAEQGISVQTYYRWEKRFALPEPGAIQIQDDLDLFRDDSILFLDGRVEPVYSCPQGRNLLHKCVESRFRHRHLIHPAHRLPTRFLYL